ncbi:MAG: FtsX-like permease family protein [Bacteroidota bacterium]
MLLKLAWRNIWRNKRRTYITAASILFAVLFASFMEALQKGVWNNTINNVVSSYMGYIQIHQKGYWEDQSIDKAFEFNDQFQQLSSSINEIEGAIPRLESFALAAANDLTSGALVVGISPEEEHELTQLKDRVDSGNYLMKGKKTAMIGAGLAEKLKVELRDTLILLSQGYRGVNAADLFEVGAIVKFPTPELNKQIVYLPLEYAQVFYGAEPLISSIALNLSDQDETEAVSEALKTQIDTSIYEVMTWQELMPDLLEAKALDSAGNYIVYMILYMIIGFGIFGTILMMTKERSYEFGVMTAVGMHRSQLTLTVWLEVILLGLLGAVAGIIACVPIVYYFNQNPIRLSGNYGGTLEKFGFEPIFPAEFDMNIFFAQALIVFLITALLGFNFLIFR